MQLLKLDNKLVRVPTFTILTKFLCFFYVLQNNGGVNYTCDDRRKAKKRN